MAQCANASVGVRTLDDLGPRLYLGRQGGLYPGGVNVRPAGHDAAGRAIAGEIAPLDAAGNPSGTGLIPIVALGFSTTKRTFDQFAALVAADADIAPTVKPTMCAVSGRGAPALADPNHVYWTQEVPALLAAAGVTREQVQVAWLLSGQLVKQQDWPAHVDTLEGRLVTIVQNAKAFFPNLKLCYVASLNYLGYAETTTLAAPEPHYFEQGFAFKRLIERQIDGDPELVYDPTAGPVKAPWIAWAGYCWSDGKLQRADGLDWRCPEDVVQDGIHATLAVGAAKLGARLLATLKGDPTAAPWLLASGAAACGQPAAVGVYGEGVAGTTGLPLVAASSPPILGTTGLSLRLARARPGATGFFIVGATQAATPFAGGHLYVDDADWVVWPLTVDANGEAVQALDDVPADPGLCGTKSYAQAAIVDDTAPGGFAMTEGLELTVGA